ncbi:thermonuclease family protein [Mycoplasma crocodyli]|uniref:Putative DNA/RNA nuclease n=1 Tax=Mycoplasma crocodyli (strain ATCC 51981 / MP145) TaxID=512564 RepID=D5E628_MYCCM|nr:thermonuclease family protein [Mycoplasma crocodyli]ADE19912.1 putative DNA/RNA nuclease [Mycoplasma crocodyli MP145]
MKKILVGLIVFLSIFFGSSCQHFDFKNNSINKKEEVPIKKDIDLNTVNIEVVSIIDGDTLIAKEGSEHYTVRLYGIDTPETLKKGNENKLAKYENFYAQRAKNYLSDLVKNSSNLLKAHFITHDDYKRKVCILYDHNNDIINKKIVENGYGIVYYITNNKNNKKFLIKNKTQKEFYKDIIESQEKAKIKRIGIWSETYFNDVYFGRNSSVF